MERWREINNAEMWKGKWYPWVWMGLCLISQGKDITAHQIPTCELNGTEEWEPIPVRWTDGLRENVAGKWKCQWIGYGVDQEPWHWWIGNWSENITWWAEGGGAINGSAIEISWYLRNKGVKNWAKPLYSLQWYQLKGKQTWTFWTPGMLDPRDVPLI